MPTFEYTGRTNKGESVRGRMEALSSGGVAAMLAEQGILPLKILPITDAPPDIFAGVQRWRSMRQIGLRDVIMFCRQMATLVKSGIPITKGIRGLCETTRNPEFARVLGELADQLEKGHELANAIQRHPAIFSNLFVAVVHIGERSGRLDESFEQLHGYLKLEEETRKQIKSALRYPTMVLIAMMMALVVINLFVIPPFADLFTRFGSELPWATQVLITSSNLTTKFWHVGLSGGLVAFWGIRHWLETPTGQLLWHRFQLRIPKVGAILERALLARFCRTLSITLGAGLPVTQCLSIASRAVNNRHVGQHVIQMREDIEGGESLTAAAESTALFTPLVLQMMAVGEETGSIEETLGEVGEYYEREVEFDLKNIGEVIEPVMIVFVGILVLGLALGVYLPLWEMGSLSGGG